MLTKRMTGRQVNGALRERHLTHYDVARVTGLPQPRVGNLLAGDAPLSPERKALIEQAIIALRLAEPLPPDDREPIFEVPVGETSE